LVFSWCGRWIFLMFRRFPNVHATPFPPPLCFPTDFDVAAQRDVARVFQYCAPNGSESKRPEGAGSEG
jgi:hypothetical protein